MNDTQVRMLTDPASRLKWDTNLSGAELLDGEPNADDTTCTLPPIVPHRRPPRACTALEQPAFNRVLTLCVMRRPVADEAAAHDDAGYHLPLGEGP